MRTKDIDVKYHFIGNLVSDGYLNLRYVSSEENYADFMTKYAGNENFSRLLFTRGNQIGNIICERENVGCTNNYRIIPNSNKESSESGFPYDLPRVQIIWEEVSNTGHKMNDAGQRICDTRYRLGKI